MDVLVSKGKVEFLGVLDEKASEQELVDFMMEAWEAVQKQGRVEIDFSRVKYANSYGLMSWMRALSQVNIPLVYVNCPIWLCENFSIIPNFFAGNILLRDIYVMFYSPLKQISHQFLFKIGEDIPFLDDYDDFELTAEFEGEKLEIDLDLGSYLSFLVTNREMLEKIKN